LGILFADIWDNPYFDGAASIIIGLILATVASVLAYETRGLLIGESADPRIVANVRHLVEQDPTVEEVHQPLTIHLGPRNILLNLDVQFRSTLSADEVASTIDRLEKAIRHQHPMIRHIFLEAKSISAGGVSR
jgi:divalent metal cation (Fe/Co/Zn/Cd) transporter